MISKVEDVQRRFSGLSRYVYKYICMWQLIVNWRPPQCYSITQHILDDNRINRLMLIYAELGRVFFSSMWKSSSRRPISARSKHVIAHYSGIGRDIYAILFISGQLVLPIGALSCWLQWAQGGTGATDSFRCLIGATIKCQTSIPNHDTINNILPIYAIFIKFTRL